MLSNETRVKVEEVFNLSRIIGSYIFSEHEYEELIVTTRRIILFGPATNNDHIVFLTLVEIAKRWQVYSSNTDENEKEGGFWDFVFKKLDISDGADNSRNKSYTKLCDVIRRVGKKIGLASNTKVYYGTVLMHALAPKRSMHAFFDLVYSIFMRDFDFFYAVDDAIFVKDIISAIRLKISKILDRESDSIIYISTTPYPLNVGIKEMIMNEKLADKFNVFFKEVMSTIHKLFHNERISDSVQNYYINELKSWWILIQNRVQQDRRSTPVKEKITTLNTFNPVYIKENLSNTVKVLLEIPSLRRTIDGNYTLKILNSNMPIYQSIIPLRNMGLTISTRSMKFNLDNLLTKGDEIEIRILIYCNEEIIYDSKNTLYRQIILFKDQNEINTSVNRIGNYFVYSRNIGKMNHNIQTMFKASNNIYSILTQNGDYLRGLFRHYVFTDGSELDNSKDIRLLGELSNVYFYQGHIQSLVFNDKVKLIIPKIKKIGGLELRIDESRTLLTKLINLETNMDTDTHYEINISEFINKEKPSKIIIYSYDNKKEIFDEYIILFPGLNLSFNESYYYSRPKNRAKMEIFESKFSEEKRFNNNDDYVDFLYADGYFRIFIPWIFWVITGKEKRNSPDPRLYWIDDIVNGSSIIEFETPYDTMSIEVFFQFENKVLPIERKGNKFHIGRSLSLINSAYEFINVLAKIDGEICELFSFTNKERFFEDPLTLDKNEFIWEPKDKFLGKSDALFTVEVKSITGLNNYFMSIPKLSLHDHIHEVSLEDGGFEIKVFREDNNPFISKLSLMWVKNIFIGNPIKEEYYHKKLMITAISFDSAKFIQDPLFKWGKTSLTYYIGNLDYISVDDNSKVFKGKLYYLNNSGREIYVDQLKDSKQVLRNINPVTIIYLSDDIFTLVPYHKNAEDSPSYLLFNEVKQQLEFDNSGIAKRIQRYKFEEV